jgi:hypothetical protein
MSPTIFREGNYRFHFFSKEEKRPHVHVESPDHEAKFWLEPMVALSMNYNFTLRELKKIQKIVEREHHVLINAWKKHFPE